MSNDWNINNIRKLAGLTQLTEAVIRDDADDVDDEDEDPSVKIAMKDKRQAAFEKKNKSELSNAEREATIKDNLAKKKAAEAQAAKKDEKKPVEKKAEPKAAAPVEKKAEPKAAAPEEKKDDATPETKKRGRAESETSKRGQARAWLIANPGAARKEFLKHAPSFEMSPAYASAYRAAFNAKSKVTECYILTHPSLPSYVLAENREMNQMQWVDAYSPLEPMIFETMDEAVKVATYMSEWKSQFSNIETIILAD